MNNINKVEKDRKKDRKKEKKDDLYIESDIKA